MHSAWERVHDECLAALVEGSRILVCGVPGTGKSVLLQDLADWLREQGQAVVLFRCGEQVVEAVETAILLVDEADRLSDEQIRQLCSRPNPLVLAGLPELRQRVTACVGLIGSATLDPLSVEDVAQFVAARLTASGRAGTAFLPDAVVALARHSGGLFRVVIILAGAALFFAEMRGAAVVAASDIDEAAAMRESIAIETEEAALTGRVAAPAADVTRWPRRILVAVFATLAVVGVAVHLVATAGGSAAAAVEVDRGAVQSMPVEAPRAAPLWPKRRLALAERRA